MAAGPGPRAVVSADFNSDNKPDLVTANNLGSTISVFLNNGMGSFLAGQSYTVEAAPFAIATGDFNEDGKLDLAVTTSMGISVLLGNGDGTFQSAVHYAATSDGSKSAGGIVAERFTGSGHLDLVVTNSVNAQVNLLVGDGQGHFVLSRSYRQFTSPLQLAVGDFNRDGRPDFVVSDGLDKYVTVYLNEGGGTFNASAQEIGIGPASVAVGDLDGDGVVDIVVGDNAGAAVLRGNGDGTFQSPVTYKASVASAICIGDVTGEGTPDLVLTSMNGVSVLPNDGHGTFGKPIDFASGSEPRGCSVLDLNGDHKIDVAVSNNASENLSLYTALTSSGLPSAIPFDVGANPGSVVLADLNHDRKLDAAVGLNDGTVAILLGDGKGNFGPARHVQTGLFRNPFIVLAVGDFNRDGNLDIVAGSSGSEDLAILFGKGDGTFRAAQMFQGSSNFTSSILAGDFNHDGVPDIAVAAYDSVYISVGKGDGTFSPSVSYWSGGGVQSGWVADFNGDGRQDLVFADLADFVVSIFLGNGDGSFQPARRIPFASQPISVAAADFNRDGKPDIVVAFHNSNHFCVLLGNGDGTFWKKDFATDTNENFVTVADLDGDHKSDVIFANDREVSVFSGRGDGTFHGAKQFAAGSDPVSVAVGSLNGDNAPDLVSVPYRATTIVPLLNAGGDRVVISATPNPATYGQSITATATISATFPNSPTPTGMVTFKNGSTTLGTVPLAGGRGALKISGLSKGSHVISASYSGSSVYNPNVASVVEQIQ